MIVDRLERALVIGCNILVLVDRNLDGGECGFGFLPRIACNPPSAPARIAIVRDPRLPRYLETTADFAALAESIPDAVYVQAITKLLSNHAERARGIADMYAAWMSGRVENVESVKQRVMLGQFPQVREMMFDRRNFAWLPKIIDILASKRRTLIVVGAGHLGGANGLLKLLDGAGHQYSDVV